MQEQIYKLRFKNGEDQWGLKKKSQTSAGQAAAQTL